MSIGRGGSESPHEKEGADLNELFHRQRKEIETCEAQHGG
jgi:hypothetical protein